MTAIEARFRGTLGRFSFDVAFDAPMRGVTALFGPSGCGKTTILRCLAGLHRAEDGRLAIDGMVWQDGRRFVAPHRRAIGYVFQEASLFAHLSVAGNLDYGRRRRRAAIGATDRDEVVGLLGLEALLDRVPGSLSGGERQRVAIGRALLSGPEVLLMDEPLAALDRASKAEILPYLERLNESLAIPTIYVSHDMAEVERLADRMVLMESGRVRAAGPLAELVADPLLPFAKTPDAAVVIAGTIEAYDPHYMLTTVAAPGGKLVVPGHIGETGTERRLRIVASDVALCHAPAPAGTSILNALPTRIVAAEPVGEFRMNVFMRLGHGPDGAHLIGRITRKSWDVLGLAVGDEAVALVKSVALTD
ncbi:MAG TPA: molybdenum ABC transporter ATP-binding protein [Hyphomicrobiales bacterium]|nr:molybdenum ABC transporter ATP-binding protein [Kaistiaceae bacterium]HQF31247.1 molybdenum ABC transporter ATP-binding protein [Hyphomicrobiales bacterium]